MTSKTTPREQMLAYGAAALVLGYLVASLVVVYGTRFEKTITVNRTYTGTRKRDTQYFVESTEGEVFEVESALLLGFFTPAEVWNEMQVGRTYVVQGFGFRVGILRWYPRIVGVDAT